MARSLTEDEVKELVWSEARPIPGMDRTEFRKDPYGNLMIWDDYGDKDQSTSWVIDHIIPESLEGSYDIENLQAMNLKKNQELQDKLTKETHYGSMRPVSGNDKDLSKGVIIDDVEYTATYTLEELKEFHMVE